MKWQVRNLKKIRGKDIYMIEGLPGMGNVGKIAVDFMVDNLKAEKVIEISSYSFPHCVFVNEDNLVELPLISLYQKQINKKTFLFVAGDIQPLDEVSCYEFCDLLLDMFQKNKGKEIITLGGIGQNQPPKSPRLYITGNEKEIIKRYSSKELITSIHGVVGPIIGVSGLLLGTASLRRIPAISILAETYGHPTYLGIKGAREMLKVLNKKFSLNLRLNEIDKEINSIEKEIKIKTKGMHSRITKSGGKTSFSGDISYIG